MTGRLVGALILTQTTATLHTVFRTWLGRGLAAALCGAALVSITVGSPTVVIEVLLVMWLVCLAVAVGVVVINLVRADRRIWWRADGRALLTAAVRNGVAIPRNACARPVGAGLAHELMQTAIDQADEENLVVTMVATNDAVAALYQNRFSFTQTGTTFFGRPVLLRNPPHRNTSRK